MITLDETKLETEKWINFHISKDTFAAFISLIIMWISFYVMYHTDSMVVKGLVFCFGANIILNVLFPVIWCVLYKKEKLDVLGITKNMWLPSLVIGVAVAYIKFYQLIPLISGTNWSTHLIYNALFFWEPFFIFGWLQSRFEKSFGILGGILLAGIGLGVYHIGSFEPINVMIIAMNGIVFASLYRITRNLLIMWPALWCISSSVGTLSGGLEFGKEVCFIYFFVMVIQIAIIYIVAKRGKRINEHGK